LEASNLPEALRDAEKSLLLDPKSADAMIVRADVARETRDRVGAEEWYLRFIEAAPNNARKSNGYAHLARTYVDAWYYFHAERPALIAKATAAYEAMVRLDPESPWKMVNYVAFLNNEAGEFEAAEQYARRTLTLRDFPAAKRHLAMAQYQKLTVKLEAMNDQSLVSEVAKTYAATSVSIEQVAQANGTGGAALERLQPLRTRLAGSGLYKPEPSR
jgi:Tfp pilus assembly protein PilF